MKENRGKQSMRTMENENLRVQISDHGAELSSIYDKAADREAVWIGDPAFWNRHEIGRASCRERV